jgi:hypothetical protein
MIYHGGVSTRLHNWRAFFTRQIAINRGVSSWFGLYDDISDRCRGELRSACLVRLW